MIRKRCGDRSKKKILRMGALKMKLIYDSNGKPFLMGGFCIELDRNDSDLELYGVDEDGFNGVMTAKIDGDGVVNLEPNVKVDWHGYLYMGDVADLNLMPYERTFTSSRDSGTDSNSYPIIGGGDRPRVSCCPPQEATSS